MPGICVRFGAPLPILSSELLRGCRGYLKRKRRAVERHNERSFGGLTFQYQIKTDQSASMSFATASGSVAQDVQKRTTQRPSGRWYQFEKTKSFSSRAFVASSRIGKI